MSPLEARVFVVEDHERYQDRIRKVLESSGHQVVLTSEELFDAVGKIRSGILDKLQVQVATVDGTLKDGTSDDGNQVAKELRRRAKGVKIVGLTYSPTGIRGANANLNKEELERLGDIVTNL